MPQNSQFNRYNPYEAVKYALRYAYNPNPSYKYMEYHGTGGGDCSNFISQCLRAGGAPMAFGTSRPWWYNDRGTPSTNDDSWSLSWSVAHSLHWCLKTRYTQHIPGLSGMEVDDINKLDTGDLIQYENSKGLVFHSAIITGFADYLGRRIPLLTQHTPNAANIYYDKLPSEKVHFLKILVT